MARNSSTILPFCKHCGEYKGLGSCKNPNCQGMTSSESDMLKKREYKCAICGDTVMSHCIRCRLGYCSLHSKGMKETSLVSLDQHVGTCTLCGETVCEQCWIFNHFGDITCQIHNSDMKRRDY